MAVFTESFNKADSSTLGPDLTWTETRGDAEVFSNKWRNVSQSDDVRTRAEHDVGSSDMYVQAKYDWSSWGNWILCVRFSASADTYYMAVGNNDNSIILYRCVAGTETSLTSTTSTTTENTQYLWRLEANGNVITLKVNGTTVLTYDDSASPDKITTGQRGGLGSWAAATQVRWDDFEVGSLSSPTNISLSAFDIVTTPGSAAVLGLNSQQATLSPFDIVTAFPTPSVSSGGGAAPGTIFDESSITIHDENGNPILAEGATDVLMTLTGFNIITNAGTPSLTTTAAPPVGVVGITLQPFDIATSFGPVQPFGQSTTTTHRRPAENIIYAQLIPPDIIKDATLAASTYVTTRMEILDKNGGVFMTDLEIESGSVTVSLDRAERRTIDINIHDPDQLIDHHPGGLWYDKVLVPYRGIRYQNHYWEAPLGRFYIDRISEPDFPYVVSITGRDQTKSLLNSKLAYAVSFGADDAPEDVIRTIAINGGVSPTRFNITPTGHTLGDSYTFERNTSRWDIISKLAEAFSLEVFFDANGYFILRPFRDPSTSPSIWTFQTGSRTGNLANFTKSGDDSRLFNHIVVVGEGTNKVPIVGEARNTLTGSGSEVDLIGERTYPYESKFVSTQNQADDLALTLLQVMALESYEMNFTALVASWLEVGEVVDIVDPSPWTDQPSRFLLTDITIPIGLGTMSGTGKRVTRVQ